MKAKKLFIYTLVAAPLCMLFRALQYLYIIDTQGNYVANSLTGTLLEYSVGTLFAVSAIIAFACMLIGEKKDAKSNRVSSKKIGVIYVVIAALMLFESGIGIGAMLSSSKLDIPAILGVFAAISYAVCGLCFIKESGFNTLTKLMGLFPPAYFCLRGIFLFFDSFKLSNVSENRLEMLAICALALWSITLSGVLGGASMKESRLASLSMLTAVFVTTPVIAQVIDFVLRPHYIELSSVLWLVQKLAFAVVAIIIILRVSFIKDKEVIDDPEPINFNNDLDVFIDDIPELADE